MKNISLRLFRITLCLSPIWSHGATAPTALTAFLEQHCYDCHDSDNKKGGLDLSSLEWGKSFESWVKVHDRMRDGEMPPKKKARPPTAPLNTALATVSSALVSADQARQQKDGRVRLRRMNRVEFENALRDLLELPALRLKESLPEDGRSHGFDRVAGALDLSFVHIESYLAAVDKALDAALCPFAEKPPVFKYRYRPWDNIRKDGKECESSIGLAVGSRTAIGLVGMQRDETFVAETAHRIIDEEPHATAIGMFRHEDADYRCDLTAIQPVLTGWHRLRLSGYSFDWDGKQVIPTERHGAVGWGIFSKGEHYGTVDLPPNHAAERELTVWLERGGGLTHGTDDFLRLIAASCENFRDYAHGPNKEVPGPMSFAPGIAIEWVEIEGPIYDQWPPASHRALFGDLPVKIWTKESGEPKPQQQSWPRGNPGSLLKDIYGERGDKRPVVFVESKAPNQDAARLLQSFLRRAFRRPILKTELDEYVAQVVSKISAGTAFEDAMLSAYRAALTSPEFLLLREPIQALDDHAIASRLASFLWSSLPDLELMRLADQGKLRDSKVLRAQTERMLNDPKSARLVESFTGQWLGLRGLNATQPDRKIYPEFMPWLGESMVMETQAYFTEMLKHDLGIEKIVKSDFAMINEPLARLYGIEGVYGWNLQRVALPPDSVRGGFLTQAAILKTTANGSVTSPVKRGAFVLEKILGTVPSPPPPDAGAIEPDVRGATTIREQLDKHRRNATCAGCHAQMDPYGFALESFDVVGEWRGQYRISGGAGPESERKRVNGNLIQYHLSLAVDCSGQLPDERRFSNVNELRDLLAAQPERLARAFTNQLITYGTGTEVSFSERSTVDAILAQTKSSQFGVRSLLHAVIQSDLFRTR